MKLYFCWS